MTDTVKVSLPAEAWTKVVDGTSATSGKVCNNSGDDVYIVEAASAPIGDPFGHNLDPGENFSYNLSTGQHLYAYPVHTDGDMSVTGD